MEMNLFDAQLVVLVCLLLGNILFGSLPLILEKIIVYFSNCEEAWNRRVKWSTFFLYFGAGVFISNSFLILLPQANEEFANINKHCHNESTNSQSNISSAHEDGHHQDSFPIPEFTVLCGFFLAYVLQETIHYLCCRFNKMPGQACDVRVRFCSCAKRHTECSRTFKDARPDQTLFGREKKLLESGTATNPAGAVANIPLEVETDAKAELLRSSILAQAVPNYGTVTNVTEPAVDNPLPVLAPPVLVTETRRLAMAKQAETHFRIKFMISSILITITLTLQYIFLGIHLGLHIEHSKYWQYLLVVCLQNFILTFSTGSYLAVGNIDFSLSVFLIGFLSIVSPVGMIISIAERSATERIPHLVTGIVSAIACGTLLYTTFYEMLRQKIFVSVTGVTKFLAITLGAVIIIALQYSVLVL